MPAAKLIPEKDSKDIWNLWMIEGAEMDTHEIPYCPCTALEPPRDLVSYSEARRAHSKLIKKNGPDYHIDAFLHGYEHDLAYDGRTNSIWLYPERFWTYAHHYEGFITPDFSTYIDFPEPIRLYNTYRMRAMGCWMARMGIPVINNVRWGLTETDDIDFRGIRKGGIVAVGSVASNLRDSYSREVFEHGIMRMVHALEPSTIVVYGSTNNAVFERIEGMSIQVISFKSRTALAYAKASDKNNLEHDGAAMTSAEQLTFL